MMLIAPPIELRPYSVPCEAPVLADLPPEVNAVHVNADARVGRDQVVLQADAADEGVRRGRLAGREPGDVQVRHELADIRQVRDALLLDGVGREGADRDGNVVNALFALLRSHDDRLEYRRFLCVDCLSYSQPTDWQGADDQREHFFVHCETPHVQFWMVGMINRLSDRMAQNCIVTPARIASGDPGVMLLLPLAFG